MIKQKKCVCICDYTGGNARAYYAGEEYKVIGYRKHYDIINGEVWCNEVVTKNNMWLGYVNISDFKKYFECEVDLLDEVDKMFNSIMDEKL